MRFKSIVLAIALALAASLGATVVFADGPQYVGPSTSTHDGNDGYFVLHNDCADAFRGSTMCTSQMIIEGGPSSKAPNPGVSGEWVNPVFVFEEGGVGAVDFSGEVAGDAHALNCLGWTSNDNADTGLSLRTNGGVVGFFLPACHVARPVACCK